MRYRHKPALQITPTTPESLFLKKQTASWLLRLLQFELPIDDNFFNLAGWLSGTPEDLARRLQEGIKLPAGARGKEKEALKHLRELSSTPSHRMADALETLFDDYAVLRPQIMQVIENLLHAMVETRDRTTNPIGGLKKLFRLNEASLQICLFAFGIENFRALEWYLEDQLELGSYNAHRLFSSMLNLTPEALRGELASLRRLGIIEGDTHLRLNDKLGNAVLNSEDKKPINIFCRPMPRAALPLELFRMPEEDKDHILKLLAHKGGAPMHILLYGAPGSGKTSFAASLVKTLGARAWSVNNLVDDDEADRRVSLCATLTLAERHEGSIVVVDEAERILDTDWDRRGSSAKAWLNDLLERKGLRVIWITNHVGHLDEAVKRRFTYSLHFDEPGIPEARQLWELVARKEKVLKKLSPETIRHLATSYPVPVATMELAIRQARALAPGKGFLEYIERVLKSQIVLRNNGEAMSEKRIAPVTYDPDAVCSVMPLEEIVDKMKKYAANIGPKTAGMGNILIYGPPGTGKTAFGHYLAERLGMECSIKLASDLLNMFVGGTEKNIRNAFDQAAKNRELLLIDEADSFISARAGAEHSWEVTQVNEFLTNLQNFQGICVCTTNFRNVLDIAAMRRFYLKVEFGYAKARQIGALYRKILAPLSLEEIDEAMLEELMRQKCLTPGDFLAVRGQFFLEDAKDVRQEDLFRALLREQKLKLERGSLGF